jgi:hypothetical protein
VVDCFFYSAVLALLHPDEWELRQGPPLEPGDTTHFFVVDRHTGKVVDPTRPNSLATGPGSPVDALLNLEAVLDHPLFTSLPGAIQDRQKHLCRPKG